MAGRGRAPAAVECDFQAMPWELQRLPSAQPGLALNPVHQGRLPTLACSTAAAAPGGTGLDTESIPDLALGPAR